MDDVEIQKTGKKDSKFVCSNTKILIVCVFSSLCSICCVLFMWLSVSKIEQIRRELRTLSHRSREINSTGATAENIIKSDNVLLKESNDEAMSNNHSLHGKELGGRHLRTNNRMKDIQGGSMQLDTPVQQPTAVHYVPIGVTRDLISQIFANNAMCVNRWHGLMCRNNTYKNKDSNRIIEFWQKAQWTKAHNGDVLSLGTNVSSPGIFTVETGGLYLLYLNVLISATLSKHDVGIFISDDKKLVCRENLDYVRGTVSTNSKAKTCSVSGVFYVEQSQTIAVKIVTTNTAIYLDSYNTNFGAVLLA
ncbi:uncharacterized protein LOC127737277 [Mytilus californianus]|uniref:uncharacterized protein LOC127737277 n=1 Tax=Mytilus californianus TaxID=6549 RepID=UPI00224813E5|nr:uncharacterized protein LOC127737277 [Mytilus californianus]